MLSPEVRTVVRHIMEAIAAGAYKDALAHTTTSRCSETDIARCISIYGRRVSAAPFAEWATILTRPEAGVKLWLIRAPLWCDEENRRSDLELFIAATSRAGRLSIELDGICVG